MHAIDIIPSQLYTLVPTNFRLIFPNLDTLHEYDNHFSGASQSKHQKEVCMERSAVGTIAICVSVGVGSFVLGGFIAQASVVFVDSDHSDEHRSAQYLGVWHYYQQQRLSAWFRRPPLKGPDINGGLAQGFCGHQSLHLSRVPLCRKPGKAGWAVILAIFHANEVSPVRSTHASQEVVGKTVGFDRTDGVEDPKDCTEWKHLKRNPLIRHRNHACVIISRSTLITLLALTDARAVFSYSDASGFRAGYASYNGQWYIEWPIAQEALVRFVPHDSHAAGTDVYPSCFPQRVDRCAHMVAGVVVGAKPTTLQVAFCGRQESGRYVLEHSVKGYAGSHGSRHLFNMLGGKVYEVDYMFAREVPEDHIPGDDDLRLILPSKTKDAAVIMHAPPKEQKVLAHVLDSLPWNHMSWSIHRGLRDILLAYARHTMDKFRQRLATLLQKTVKDTPHLFDARGWDPQFVRNSMGDMAASAVLAGEGNSGDLVRVVTDVVRVLAKNWTLEQLDEVVFWRLPEAARKLDMNGVVALTKVFVLEWSVEFDYQMYHQLPTTLYFA